MGASAMIERAEAVARAVPWPGRDDLARDRHLRAHRAGRQRLRHARSRLVRLHRVLPDPAGPRHQRRAGRRHAGAGHAGDRPGPACDPGQHRLPAAAGFRHGRAVGRPALPDIRQQAAPGGRHHRDGRRLRAGPDGPRSDWRGQHAHPAVRVAHGGDPGRPGHHRQRRGRAVAAPARLRPSGAPAAAGRETAARRRGRGAGIRPGLAGRQ
ncbi:hypothetical protein G6F23_013098 [Rhizopus arrhizus]|nr:hypothetical protein G6F23_013098 [Rhizopus arrhizus]